MTSYRFHAVTAENRPETGAIEATTIAEARRLLIERGLYPLHVAQEGRDLASILATPIGRRSLSHAETGQLLSDLGHLIGAGVEVAAALGVMSSAGASPKASKVIEALAVDVRRGRSLSEAMKNSDAGFPAHVIAVARAGEVSGSLAQGLVRVGASVRRTAALRSQVRTALIYPACVAVAASIAILVLLGIVVPALENIFAGAAARLPWQTRTLVATGHFVRDNVLGLGLFGVALVSGGVAAYKIERLRVRLEAWMLQVPVVGKLLIAAETSRTCILLAMLAAAGLPLAKGLAISGDAARLLLTQSALKAAAFRLREGEHLHEALDLVPTLDARSLALIRIGEATSRLSDLLDEAARDAELRVTTSVDRLLALLTPAMTLAFGAVAGFVLYTVMTSILTVNDLAIRRF